jgi:hypothetical protein
MSWSTSASGKPADVAKTVAYTLNEYKCPLPEEVIKQSALAIIKQVCGAQPDNVEVSVSAYGSQSFGDDDTDDKAMNSLTISISATRIP